jgi:hypothetical protein
MVAAGASAQQVGSSQFPGNGSAVDLAALAGPRFLVTVDTEEEFDWNAPFSRDGHGLSHLVEVPRFQTLCRLYDVTPLYLVDYPVVADGFGAELFSGLAKDGDAEIGLQLHPWVTPPFVEEVSEKNSYSCNLPAELERAKLHSLFELVVKRLGVKPESYRAGRYGAGARTPTFLSELGMRADSSVRACFDYSDQGGPDYSRHPVTPYWVERGKLLEIPLTTVFAGMAKNAGSWLFDRAFRTETMRSLLARSGMLERISLTPEGIPIEKAIEAIDIALEAKLPILVFSFHSPSLAIGHTPYVNDMRQLELFYQWWHLVFDHLRRRGVAPTTIREISTAAFR